IPCTDRSARSELTSKMRCCQARTDLVPRCSRPTFLPAVRSAKVHARLRPYREQRKFRKHTLQHRNFHLQISATANHPVRTRCWKGLVALLWPWPIPVDPRRDRSLLPFLSVRPLQRPRARKLPPRNRRQAHVIQVLTRGAQLFCVRNNSKNQVATRRKNLLLHCR